MRLFIPAIFTLAALAAEPPGNVQPPPPATDTEARNQRTIPRLDNFQGLAGLMNLARGTVRIVAIISPSSPDSEAGMEAMLGILHSNPSKRLRAYVLLTSASKNDTALRAVAFAGQHLEKRILYLWDPSAIVAGTWRPSLGLPVGPIHSVYFLYDTPAAFSDVPPKPDMWMQNHPGLTGPPLDRDALAKRAGELVKRVESKAASAAHKGE